MYSISTSDKQLYDEGFFSLKGIVKAYKSKDPRLAEYVIKLCIIDPAPIPKTSKEGVSPIDYKQFRANYHKDSVNPDVLRNIKVPDFGENKMPHQKIRQKKAQLFTQRFEEFLRNPSMVPERLKMGEFLIMLYEDPSLYAQDQFREVMRYVPLKWGPWQAFKYVMRRGVIDQRWSTFTVMYERFCALSPFIYTRKVYRQYRSSLPNAVFPINMDTLQWDNSWTFSERARANDITTETSIFFRRRISRLIQKQFFSLTDEQKEALLEPMIIEAKEFSSRYSRTSYKTMVSTWAHQLSWTRDSAPLMRIFQNAKTTEASEWALQELIENHHSTLVNLSPQWIVEKGCNKNTETSIKKFIGHWITDPITNIPKNEFLSNGIFRVVLAFIFDNKTFGPRGTKRKVQSYACAFIREFLYELKDYIPFDRVMWLLRNRSEELHELGLYLLFPEGERKSPFAENLTLDFWTELLGDARLHSYGVQSIEKNFSKRALSKEWIKGRLYDPRSKIADLAKEYIAEGRHEANIDWYDVYLDNLFGNPGAQDLTQWAWEHLKKVGPDGKSLLSRFTPEEYRKLMVHSERKMRMMAYDAYNNEHIKPEDFPVRFLRNFIHRDEYDKDSWKSYFTIENINHSYSLPDDLKAFCVKTLDNRLDRTAENLGYRWVLENRSNTRKEYAFVRQLFQDEFPIYLLALLDDEVEEDTLTDSKQAKANACSGVLELICQEYNQKSALCVFWRDFLRSRLARFRQEKGLQELNEVCVIDPSFFSFAWFKQEIEEDQKERRAFALSLGSLFLRDWISNEKKFGFVELEPLILSYHSDVAQFTINAIRNPSSQYVVVDISGPQFTPEELYGYIFSENPAARRQGVQIIYGNLEKFAQPDKLVQLTYSPDPFVRAMVISIMYQIAHIPQVTPKWTVYEDSVIPNNSKVSSVKRIRTKRVHPQSGESITSQKILGAGAPENLEPKLKDYDSLIDFAKRELFRIPKNPPKKKGNKGKAKAGNQVPGWKTKRTLMEAFRDLSLQDRVFAQKMIPIFQELILYKGVIVRDMAMSSLAYIEKHYEQEPLAELSFLTEYSVQEPQADNT